MQNAADGIAAEAAPKWAAPLAVSLKGTGFFSPCIRASEMNAGLYRLRKNPDGLDFYHGAVATGSTVPGAEPRGRKTTIEV